MTGTDFKHFAEIIEAISNSQQFIIDLYTELKKQDKNELKNVIYRYNTEKKLFKGFIPTEAMKQVDDNCKVFTENYNEFESELANIYVFMSKLQQMLDINPSDEKILFKTKELFIDLIQNYEASIKNLDKLKFDKNLEKLINDNNTKALFKNFVKQANKKEQELKNKRLRAKINDKEEEINLNAIQSIIIFDPEHFKNRINELKALYKTGEPPSIFKGLSLLIKEFSMKHNNAEITDNLMNAYISKNKELISQKVILVQSIINSLKTKSNAIKLLKEKMGENNKKYLESRNINFEENHEKLKDLLDKLNSLPDLNDNPQSAQKAIELVIELVTNKKINVFKTVLNEEIKIITGLNTAGFTQLIQEAAGAGFDLNAISAEITQEIEKSKAYAIIDKDAFAKEISQMSKDELIQKLTELKTMGKYN
ncbi:MAG: hypothetical protein PHG04_04460, partial [Candidatus Nanoarchaeia archaeon]|nr:hypothetical protein [Candidatus Nanoarchaeia archaeon]